jgi:hypothetical protein
MLKYYVPCLLKKYFSRTKYFNKYYKKINDIYDKNWNLLSDFNIEIIKFILSELGINCKLILSSKLKIRNIGTEALIEICEKINSKEYISRKDGKNYLILNKFDKKN